MGAMVLVIALVNVVALALVRDAGSTLHDQASPRSMRVDLLRVDLADMNGAQNLYLIDPLGGRPVYLESVRTVRRDLALVRPLETSRLGSRLLGAFVAEERRFEQLDATVWAALQAGQTTVAQALAAGVETTLYDRIRRDATEPHRD